MNKILIAGLAALALTTALEQQAQSWSKSNFGVGFNWGWEGGGNSFLWGAARGANVPNAGDPGSTGNQGFGGYPAMPPYPVAPGTTTEPPLAPSSGPEKVAPPTPIKPAVYNLPQPTGYYPGYSSYPAYPMYSSYPVYPGYYGW